MTTNRYNPPPVDRAERPEPPPAPPHRRLPIQPVGFCSQCGKPFAYSACGPTHAAIYADRVKGANPNPMGHFPQLEGPQVRLAELLEWFDDVAEDMKFLTSGTSHGQALAMIRKAAVSKWGER